MDDYSYQEIMTLIASIRGWLPMDASNAALALDELEDCVKEAHDEYEEEEEEE